MKRRYKQGDWFRVPLGGEHDAIGIITRADRSRLHGYFFAVNSSFVPAHEHLRELRSADAVLTTYFGGTGLEEQRWPIIATSLTLDETRWPAPPPADGRYATPIRVERMLRAVLRGEEPETPLAVYEARPPIDTVALHTIQHGGRVQFSRPLSAADIDALGAFFRERSDVELRVHGAWPDGFDLRTLLRVNAVQSLVLDCRRMRGSDALSALVSLRSLRVGATEYPVALGALRDMLHLRSLHLRGAMAEVEILQHLRELKSLSLIDTRPLRLASIASAHTLKRLTIAHTANDLDELPALAALEELELRDIHLERLPDLSRLGNLRSLVLRNVRGVRDLSALREPPSLQELVIEGMYQLEVPDFQPLAASERLPALTIEIGSKSKSREIYRMLRGGRKR
ncbi:MAG TPA: Imm26 family immunity protein [Candidatus Baltobacteraceae bacterium]|nr:Imm26 family immunity protein [Candidatus Baltobacteraceae bacterium]